MMSECGYDDDGADANIVRSVSVFAKRVDSDKLGPTSYGSIWGRQIPCDCSIRLDQDSGTP